MKIYKFDCDINKGTKLVYKDMSQRPDIQIFFEEPLAGNWKPLEVICKNKKKNTKYSDLAYFSPYTISERVMNVLKDLIGEQAEFLPLFYEEGKYYIFNVLNNISALDYDSSIFEYYIDGKIEFKKGRLSLNDEKPIDIFRINFDPEKIQGNLVFMLKENMRWSVFVTDDFKKIIDDNHFTGFEFKLIWDEDIDYEALDAEKERLESRDFYYQEYPIENSFAWDADKGVKLMKKELKFSIFTADKQAKQVSVAIDKYLEDHIIPPIFNTLEDYSTHLSYCFGDALAFHEWGWCRLGEDKRIALVDKDQNGSFFIMDYILSILKGENPNGNDLMEIFELTTKVQPGEKKYIPIR